MKIFEVQFYIVGPIRFENNLNFQGTIELNVGRVFNNEINIQTSYESNIIYSVVSAENINSAQKVAAVYIGNILDVLAVMTNCKLEISLFENRNSIYNIKTIVNFEEIQRAFQLAIELNLHVQNNKMLCAYSWYRKGMNSDNLFDKFLSFWNSILIISNTYFNDNEQTRANVINRIWDCFRQVWGQCSEWPLIRGNENWVKEHNIIRNQIAHGDVTIGIEYVNKVIDKIEIIEKVSYKFLRDFSVLKQINL